MEFTEFLIHFMFTLVLLLPVILISRSVVAGTKYSPILIIVVFGLFLGYIIESTGLGEPGLPGFPMVGFTSGTTVIALVVTFFVGGQKLRNTFWNPKELKEDDVTLNEEEIILGTKGTQFVFMVRAFFILVGVNAIIWMIYEAISDKTVGTLSPFLPLIAFLGLAGSIIFIDSKAKIANKRVYLGRGIIELAVIMAILVLSFIIAGGIKDIIALPQIFFAMLLSSGLGMIFSDWRPGPTMRALLFAGIPMVLAAVFIVGGTRLASAFTMDGMTEVMAYGFFGQLFWMFGGIALLVFIGKSNKVDILAPGMAGSLSHSGLTGACTAGDIGEVAKERAPIMINIPFFGHIFVFTILALSASRNELLVIPAILVVLIGVALTYVALKTLRNADNQEKEEIKGLIFFSIGWQLVAVFGGFVLLDAFGMELHNAAMANSSAISHFGLFASIQGGMFDVSASGFDPAMQPSALISFIFAMPFLIHPFVFGMFGKAMSNNGEMPKKAVAALAIIGVIGVLLSLIIL
jgi:hypothetical protein